MSLSLNNRHLAILGIILLAVIAARLIIADTGTAPLNPGHPLSQTWIDTNLNMGSYNVKTAGTIESTSGGFKFPDGTTQASKGLTNSDKNVPSGIAGLDANGKISSAQLPNNIIYQYDALYGRTGTASGWTTTPSSLSELTDGNTNNFATAGTITGDGTGYITYDLGSTVLVNSIDWNFEYALTTTGGGWNSVWSLATLNIEKSTDGTTYSDLVTVSSASNGAGTGVTQSGDVKVVNGLVRYVRIKCYAGSTQPGSSPSTCTLYGKRIRALTNG